MSLVSEFCSHIALYFFKIPFKIVTEWPWFVLTVTLFTYKDLCDFTVSAEFHWYFDYHWHTAIARDLGLYTLASRQKMSSNHLATTVSEHPQPPSQTHTNTHTHTHSLTWIQSAYIPIVRHTHLCPTSLVLTNALLSTSSTRRSHSSLISYSSKVQTSYVVRELVFATLTAATQPCYKINLHICPV
jgi:hypothetical protein